MSDTATVEQPTQAPAPAKASVYEASKEIAVRKDGAANLPMPTTFAQMQDFASTMSRAGPMVGKPFRDNPGACLAILTQSMRWGMDPYAVSQKAYVAAANGDGPVGYEGQLVAAVVTSIAPLQRRLRCEYIGEGDDRQIVVTGYLKGEDEPFTYTSPVLSKLRPQKNQSGYLKGSQLWETDPDQQLWYYGVRAWARKWTPDVIMGVYTPDELSEAIQRGRDEGGGEVITLGGAVSAASEGVEGPAKDAEFTPIDSLVNRGNSPKPVKEKGGDQKDAAQGSVGSTGAAQPPGKAAGKKAKAPEPQAGSAAALKAPEGQAKNEGGGQPAENPAPAAAEAEPAAAGGNAKAATPANPVDYRGVEETITTIEGLVEGGKTLAARKYVNANREELEAAVAGDKPNLAARAKAILEKFPK